MDCAGCGSSIALPDGDNRYCPVCGHMLVMRDPPGDPESEAWLILGEHEVGPATGNLYCYHDPNEAPTFVDPLAGPFLESTIGGDLWSSSDAPAGIRVLDEDPWTARESRSSRRDWSISPSVGAVAARHGRLYCVATDTSQVEAWDVHEGERVRHWAFAHAKLEGFRPGSAVGVSETLVCGMCRPGTSASVSLRALHAGTGQVVLDQPLPYEEAVGLVSRGRAFVIGRSGTNAAAVAVYELGTASPVQTHELAVLDVELAGGFRSAPALLDGHLIFDTPDSRVWRWSPEYDEPPVMIWSPPSGYTVQPIAYPLEQGQIGYLAVPDSLDSVPLLIKIGRQTPEASPDQVGVSNLPQMPHGDDEPRLACCHDHLFVCIHQPGNPVTILRRRLAADQGAWDDVTTITGTQRTRRLRMMCVPTRDGPGLCVQIVQDNSRYCYLVTPRTGAWQAVEMHPHADDDVRVVWTGKRTLRVNLALGKVQVIG